MDEGLTIHEAAQRVGLSVDTLRYYERAGLLNHIVRTSGGQRRYVEANLAGINFVTKMRATGMPIRQIRAYMETPILEDGTSPARRDVLVQHRANVLTQISELRDALALIDKKIALYDANGLGCGPVQDPASRESLASTR